MQLRRSRGVFLTIPGVIRCALRSRWAILSVHHGGTLVHLIGLPARCWTPAVGDLLVQRHMLLQEQAHCKFASLRMSPEAHSLGQMQLWCSIALSEAAVLSVAGLLAVAA